MLQIKLFQTEQKVQFFYIFLFGFLFGIFFMYFVRKTLIFGTGFLEEDLLYQMKYLELDENSFFVYVLKKRFSLFFFIVLFATTYVGIFAIYCALIGSGFAFGILLSGVFFRYGVKGILLILIALFPQYIFYIPAFWMLFYHCYELCAVTYFPSKVYGKVLYRNEKGFLVSKIGQILVLLLFVFIGALMESNLNPILVTNFLKIF